MTSYRHVTDKGGTCLKYVSVVWPMFMRLKLGLKMLHPQPQALQFFDAGKAIN